MISKLLGWIMPNPHKRTYYEDDTWWISKRGFGVNTEHPEYLKKMSRSFKEWDDALKDCESRVLTIDELPKYNHRGFCMEDKSVVVLKGAENSYTRGEVVNAINLLVDICHSASVRGGWWNDLTTGEPLERNKLEMLALIHSEVSEATEGVRKGVNDDHLPQYPMETVEIADMFVRGFDYAGGHGLTVGDAFFDKVLYNANRADHKPENRMKEGGKKS